MKMYNPINIVAKHVPKVLLKKFGCVFLPTFGTLSRRLF